MVEYRSCPECGDVVLIAIDEPVVPEELANKQAAHDIQRSHR